MENDNKYSWIEYIIYTNVVSKIRGSLYANILDISLRGDNLLKKINQSFKDSRLYLYDSKELKLDIYKTLKNRDEIREHNYDLILSIFDFHTLNEIQISEQIRFIKEISGNETIILLSDIYSNNFASSILLKVASFINKRLKTIISKEDMIKLLEEHEMQIIDKEEYRINHIWSYWILNIKKK